MRTALSRIQLELATDAWHVSDGKAPGTAVVSVSDQALGGMDPFEAEMPRELAVDLFEALAQYLLPAAAASTDVEADRQDSILHDHAVECDLADVMNGAMRSAGLVPVAEGGAV